MRYEKYEEKMKKIRKFRNGLFHLRFVFLGVGIITVATTSALMGCTGMVNDAEILHDTYEFGEEFKPGGSAFLSDVSYQYRKKDSDNWTEDKPHLAGEYEYRYYTTNAFGQPKYSEVHEFKIAKRPITVDIKFNEVVYGDLPAIDQPNLLSNHKIESYSVKYDSFENFKTNAIVENIKIVEDGKLDVTDSYDITYHSKEITFEKRQLSVEFGGGWKYYDGKEYFIDKLNNQDKLNLAFDDQISLGDPHKITEVGKFENMRDIKVINSQGVDVTKLYRIYASAGIVEVKKLPITVESASVNAPYSGNEILKEIETGHIAQGSPNQLVSGHQIKIKCKDKEMWRAGTSKSNEFECQIVDQLGNNVSHLYDIKKVPGFVNITRKNVTVFIAGVEDKNGVVRDSKVYDGRPIRINDITCNQLVPGDKIVVEGGTIEDKVNANQGEKPGDEDYKYDNTATFKIFRGTEDVTDCYNFEQNFNGVRILKRPIKVKCQLPKDKEYDGKPLTLTSRNFTVMEGDNISYFDLADGQKLVADTSTISSIVTPGSIDCSKFRASIKDKNGNDVTFNYDIQYVYFQDGNEINDIERDGFAKILKRKVSIFTSTYTAASHFFDIHDVPIGEINYAEGSNKLVNGDNFKCFSDDKRFIELIPGTKKYRNIIRIGIVNSDGKDVTYENYDLDTKYGDIQLDTAQIFVYPKTHKKDYDGTKYYEESELGLTFSDDSPRPSYFNHLKATGTVYSNQIRQTEEEEPQYPLDNDIHVKPESVRIINELNGEDVTNSFIVTIGDSDAKLIVSKVDCRIDIKGKRVPLGQNNTYVLDKKDDIIFKGVPGDRLDTTSFEFTRNVTSVNQDNLNSANPNENWDGRTTVNIKNNSYIIRNQDDEDVTKCYKETIIEDGIFEGYYDNKVTIRTSDVTKQYDGKPFSDEDLKDAKYIQADNLLEGHKVIVKPGSDFEIIKNKEKYINVKDTYYGDVKNVVDFVIVDGDNHDVTNLYANISVEFGDVLIKPREIHLSSKNKIMRYNPDKISNMNIGDASTTYEVGTDREQPIYLQEPDDLLPNTQLFISGFGTSTDKPGQSNAFNTWEMNGSQFRIHNTLTGYDEDPYNYRIIPNYATGNLKIKKIAVVITSENINIYYNDPYKLPEYSNSGRLSCTQLMPGDELRYEGRSFIADINRPNYSEVNAPKSGITIVESGTGIIKNEYYEIIEYDYGRVNFIYNA